MRRAAMDRDYKRLTKFLVDEGIEDVPHTQKAFLGHLIAVHRFMEEEGLEEAVCRGGMFHSIYGTERLQGFKLPLERREELSKLIGEWAERLAYMNCAMDRASFDQALANESEPFRFRDRITGDEFALSRGEFDDLSRVHLYDWLEQVPRSEYGWGYRRTAYIRMAQRLGERTMATYKRIFA